MAVNRKLLLSVIFIVCLFSVNVTLAVQISTNIPFSPSNTAGPCGLIFGFYNYALMIGGILAFAAITYGGIKYTLAAGNPSGQSEGKEWVKGAILGLLLLIGAYAILNIINPDLTKCTLPQLAPVGVNVQQVPITTPTGLCFNNCAACSTLTPCNNTPGCVWNPTSPSLPFCKPTGSNNTGPCAGNCAACATLTPCNSTPGCFWGQLSPSSPLTCNSTGASSACGTPTNPSCSSSNPSGCCVNQAQTCTSLGQGAVACI